MNEQDRVGLVRSIARLASAPRRAAAIADLSSALGAEDLWCFQSLPGQREMHAASGFAQTMPEGDAWRSFMAACAERQRHSAELLLPETSELKTLTGFAYENGAVFVLVGCNPDDDLLNEFSLLLPLVATALLPEHASLDVAEGTLNAARNELARANRELTQTREQAAAAASAKDDFLATLAHELRTPLNPVLLIASEAAENPKLSEAVRRDFATIAKNAEIEGRLIDDLMDITRITRGKMSLDKRSGDLRAVLEDAIATVRARLDTKKINFVTLLDPKPHPIFGDSTRLQQAFWNLLKNAVKFTPAGGDIRIETRIDSDARQIVATLTDGGGDLAPNVAERIFGSASGTETADPFSPHRANSPGLGLTISRLLVQLHGGTLEAARTAPEKGIAFTVRLPLAATASAGPFLPSDALPATAPEIPETRAHLRVLVVEDHEPTSVALARLLKRRNFEVVVAASVAEALTAVETSPFDLAISDIGLPDGDGYGLMTIFQHRYRLPGIAVTGYGMPADIERSEAAGFIAHVTKPVSVRALEAALDLIVPPPTGKR